MAKIYKWPKEQPFYEFLDEVKEAYDKGLLRNFVCFYSRDYHKDEDPGDFVGRNGSYWFGKSSSECLGLTELMKQQILDFIREANYVEEEVQ